MKWTRGGIGLLVGAVFLLAAPAGAELTRKEQTCVNYLNARLRELNRTIQRETDRCIRDYNRGARFSADDPTPVTDIPACVAADRRGRIAKAIAAVQRQYERRCVGIEKNSEIVPVLGSDAATIVQAVNDNGGSVVSLVYGEEESTPSALRVAESDVDSCQAAVTEGLHLCQDAVVVEFQRCVKRALKAGKEPVRGGATSVADLSVCLGWDPSGRVARKCDDPEGSDPIRDALAKSCPTSEVNLAEAFPRCGATSHEEAHACLEPRAACSVCQKLREAGGLMPNCDQFDDGIDNLSCGCGDGIPTPAEECDDGNTTDEDGCSAQCRVEGCGDGVLQTSFGEECDDGNDVDDDACSNTCTLPGCGDGQLHAGEECDDGNDVDGDGCSASCKVEFCGDGIANDGEACDGADASACGDGICSASCACGTVAFVSSTTHTGDLGGRAGADATCQSLATGAGLGGQFKAWLSTFGDHAADHMSQSSGPYLLVDGTEIASDFGDLSDWSIAAPISIDETGASIIDTDTVHVWTHTEGSGEAVPGDPCNAWTSSASTRFAVYGLGTASTSAWTRSAYLNCDMTGRLYCIQQ